MSSRILKFELNEPVTVALQSTMYLEDLSPYGRFQHLYMLMDQRRMYVPPIVTQKIKSTGINPGDSFGIRKYKKGRQVFYDVWLAPATEKARAIEEAPAIAAELRKPPMSAVIAMPKPAEPLILAPTGTDGPSPMPAAIPLPAPIRRQRTEAIPFNVAFREVTRFVKTELSACEEQWNDEARQALVSTVLIAAAKNG